MTLPRPRAAAGNPAARPRGAAPRLRAAPAGKSRRLYARGLLSGRARRLCRFAITGGLAGAIQLALLLAFTRAGWPGLPANLAAFVLSAQLNFIMSGLFTWRDRLTALPWPRRWLFFHCSIASMAVLNMLVFALARLLLPDLAASALGIATAATGNFLLGDRVVFRARRQTQPAAAAADQEPAA